MAKEPNSAKTLRGKLWWMNILGAFITLLSLSLIITALILGWPTGDVALFTVFATSGVNSLRIEAEKLLELFMAKYRKDYGLKDPKESTKK